MPVLTFVGSGVISVYGLPKDCLVTAYRELHRLLIARRQPDRRGHRRQAVPLAQHPATWSYADLRSFAETTGGTRTGIERPLTSGGDAGSLCGVEPLDTKPPD